MFWVPGTTLQGLDVLHWVAQTVPGPRRCYRKCPIAEGRTPCGWDDQRQVVGGQQATTGTHFGGPMQALSNVCRNWAVETAMDKDAQPELDCPGTRLRSRGVMCFDFLAEKTNQVVAFRTDCNLFIRLPVMPAMKITFKHFYISLECCAGRLILRYDYVLLDSRRME